MRIDRVTLPVSRVVLQYREDGKNLVVSEDVLAILYEAEQQGASIWSEADYTAVTAFGEVFPGDASHPTWWALAGTAPAATTVHVTVDDEQVPAPTIHRLADCGLASGSGTHPASMFTAAMAVRTPRSSSSGRIIFRQRGTRRGRSTV